MLESALAAMAILAAGAQPAKLPNLVMILQDDLGYYDNAFNGNVAAANRTGNVTGLANDGIILTAHYVFYWCSPTRRSFLTGRLPIHHGEMLSSDQGDDIDLRWKIITQKLDPKGYQSYWFGKGHTGYRSMAHLPTHRGFKNFTGFLGGSQSYTATQRWRDGAPYKLAGTDAAAGTLAFSKGGSQGGRNWCRCDQCAYAANLWAGHQWCGADAEVGKSDARIISGSWTVENVWEELDTGAEFFYNESTEMLYVMPNSTGVLEGDNSAGTAPPPELNDLVVPVLQQLIVTTGTQATPVKDLTIKGVNFRDSTAVYEEQWEVPSGGDWALHRSAAVFLQGTVNATVQGGVFKRLDGNAIMLNGYNRDATITQNEFVYIADNVIAGWGETKEWDGRNGDQPRNTLVSENYIHELGFFEKQSSAFFQAKTAQTTIKDNVMFNMPRAAINFNDGFGGGNIVSGNLIWNTCRESGDHGPINTWDRQAFFTDVPEPPGFSPVQTLIQSNFIFANYGAAQGVDNDDGSSYYTIDRNVFFDADGFKMDYGGHGSSFTNNLVVTKPHGGACMGLGGFEAGHGDTYTNNTCALLGGNASAADKVGSISQCAPAENTMRDNTYFTASGKGSLGGCGSTPIEGLFAADRVEKDSKVAEMPTDQQLVEYAKAWLGD